MRKVIYVQVCMLAITLTGLSKATGPAAVAAEDPPSPSAVTERVDEFLRAARAEAGVTSGPLASDAEFLRRASLDLTGLIPSVNEVRAFLADERPHKRELLINRLLEKPSYATHLARTWRDAMLPSNSAQAQFQQTFAFDNWLRGRFADNAPYDDTVREILTTTGQINQAGPALYYASLELKPEELAASTSRVFLGVQIQCAQCHQHPFDHWSQADFWGYAAFFAQLQRPTPPQQFVAQVLDATVGEVTLPGTETIVSPRFLGATAPSPSAEETRRKQLAAWVTSGDNPYFAKAAVNRVWAHLFGRGLVNPVDDFGEHNPASHPELLEDLASDFAAHGFDIQRLLRILTNTEAYQLSSKTPVSGDVAPPELFARMQIKSLTADQIYDCLLEATRRREPVNPNGQYLNGFNGNFQERRAFVAKFEAPTQGATEFQAGIPQALTMMNGDVIASATDVDRSDILGALLDAPFFDNAQRVEILFLATLSRLPTESERLRCVSHVTTGGPEQDSRKALSDVLWALLNSAEFILNH